MTGHPVLATWIIIGLLGGLAELWMVRRGQHERGHDIRLIAQHRPYLILGLFALCALAGPIQWGILLGSYRKP